MYWKPLVGRTLPGPAGGPHGAAPGPLTGLSRDSWEVQRKKRRKEEVEVGGQRAGGNKKEERRKREGRRREGMGEREGDGRTNLQFTLHNLKSWIRF